MNNIEGKIADIIADNLNSNKVFVFPSEISAAFWQKKSLELTGKNAVLSKKFISWDRFKEKSFFLNFQEKPCNNIYRKYFVKEFLESNSGVLKIIINPLYSYNSPAFENYIVSILPFLNNLFTDSAVDKLPSDLKNDLQIIYTEYRKFLDLYSLFEPNYVIPEFIDSETEYLIFYYSIIKDFAQFSKYLSGLTNIELINEKAELTDKIHAYENPYNEVFSCLMKIQSLLDNGTDFNQIAITVCNKEYFNIINFWAAYLNLKFNIKSGKQVSEYSAGCFFLMLDNIDSENFSIESLKSFLLDPAFPFKFREQARKLISLGIEYNCYKNNENGKYNDLWKKKLIKSGNSEILGFYSDLKSNIKIIKSSKSFLKLKQALYSFINKYFEVENWNADEYKVLQFIIESIDDYVLAERELDFSTYNIFDFWLKDTGSKIYVRTVKEAGINVFPFEVSAGIRPEYHFVLAYSEKESKVINNNFPFLNDEYRSRFPDSEADFSDEFMNYYNLAGNEVLFSYARNKQEGPQLAPSYWLKNNGLVNEKDFNGPLEIEKAFWEGSNKAFKRIYDFQVDSLASFIKTSFSEKIIDYTKSPIQDSEILDFSDNKLMSEGKMYISASSLGQYNACPFKFYLNRLLDLYPENYEFSVFDNLFAGTVYHKVLKIFSDSLDGKQKNISSDIEEHKDIMKKTINKVFKDIEAKGLDFISPVWAAFRLRVTEDLMAFIDNEHRYLSGYAYCEAEKKLEYEYQGENIVLNGNIDRISKDAEEFSIVIDYKRSYVPGKSGILSKEDGAILEYQMAFYYYLLEKNGYNVKSAAYYNIIKQEYKTVFGNNVSSQKTYFNEEEQGYIVNRLEKDFCEMYENIKAGRFQVSEMPSCDNCEFNTICRNKFGVKIG